MPLHLFKEIEKLKKMILAQSAKVQDSVRDALVAAQTNDSVLAQKVIDEDSDIDETEVDIEEECLKTLALHQPVAADLRFIVSILKINNDLERIGDLATNIAQRASSLASLPERSFPFDFKPMINAVKLMLDKSLRALIDQDVELADEVRRLDDTVDDFNRKMFVKLQQGMQEKPADIEQLLHLISISKYLERIGDCATNIAEDVIYMIQGRIVRHVH